MNRLVLIITLILISYSGFCQKKSLKIEFDGTNYENIEKLFSDIESKSEKQQLSPIQKLLDREIVCGFQVKKMKITKFEQDADNPSVQSANIRYVGWIERNNELFYYQVEKDTAVKLNDEWKRDVVTIKMDSLIRLNEFKEAFFKTYGHRVDFNDLFADDIVFGTSCSIDGSEPIPRQALNVLISKKNIALLNKWLRSPIVELQLYAIDGFYTLQNRGVDLQKSTIELISMIEQKTGFVNYCAGCNYWDESIKKVVELIKKEHNSGE